MRKKYANKKNNANSNLFVENNAQNDAQNSGNPFGETETNDFDQLSADLVKKNKQKRIIVGVAIFMLVVILALTSAILVRYFMFKTFTVDGDSMLPTLNGGVMNDATDGDKVVILKNAKLNRGDIVVLYSTVFEKTLIKRVIAVEGDKIKIVDGKLFLNGELQNETYINEPMNSATNMTEITVQAGHYFCMGDNRNHSSDSRTAGAFPKSSIHGKVVMIKFQDGGSKFI